MDDTHPLSIQGLIDAERERCAALVETMRMDEILLAAGEMSAQERRTVRTLQKWLAYRIRNRKT